MCTRIQVLHPNVCGAALKHIFSLMVSVEGRKISSMGESYAEKTTINQVVRPYAELYGLFVKHNVLFLHGMCYSLVELSLTA